MCLICNGAMLDQLSREKVMAIASLAQSSPPHLFRELCVPHKLQSFQCPQSCSTSLPPSQCDYAACICWHHMSAVCIVTVTLDLQCECYAFDNFNFPKKERPTPGKRDQGMARSTKCFCKAYNAILLAFYLMAVCTSVSIKGEYVIKAFQGTQGHWSD